MKIYWFVVYIATQGGTVLLLVTKKKGVGLDSNLIILYRAVYAEECNSVFTSDISTSTAKERGKGKRPAKKEKEKKEDGLEWHWTLEHID